MRQNASWKWQTLRIVGDLRHRVRNILADQRGATAIEYGLLVALLGMAMIGAGSQIDPGFQSISDKIEAALGL